MPKKQTLLAATLGLFVTSSFLSADDSGRVSLGDFLISRSPAIAPSMSIGYTLASEVDFESVAGGLSFEQVEVSVPLSKLIYLNDHHAIVFGLDYTSTWLDTDTVVGDMDLHDIRLSLRWMYKQPGSKWAWTTNISPGIATDGGGISSDDFVVSGQAGFRYRVSSKFAWLGGIVFFSDPLETRVFPGIGFQWMPNDDVIVRFNGPFIRASWQPCEDWLFHADVRPSGGAWNVEQGGNEFNVQFDVLEAGIGIERRLSEKVWLGVWAGATFINDLEVETTSGNSVFDQDAETGWFARIGIRKILW
ncbi:MAG: DUF6268 family outer membrane beta-barrel protein [Akkermansiaceae bacterium]